MKFCILGPPGSGKGTQSSLLSEKLKLHSVSVGDILRTSLNKNIDEDSNAAILSKKMASGGLLPDDIVASFLFKELLGRSSFIIDGYPRTVEQAKLLDNFLVENKLSLTNIICLKVENESVLLNRIQSRYICSDCYAVYSSLIDSKKDKCTNCGSFNLSLRSDDSEKEIFLTRMKNYYKNITDLIDFYSVKGYNPIFVDANRGINEINQDMLEKLNLKNQ